jgi:hypothetical protein
MSEYQQTHRGRWEANWEQEGYRLGVSIRRQREGGYWVACAVQAPDGHCMTTAGDVPNHTSARWWGKRTATALLKTLQQKRGRGE